MKIKLMLPAMVISLAMMCSSCGISPDHGDEEPEGDDPLKMEEKESDGQKNDSLQNDEAVDPEKQETDEKAESTPEQKKESYKPKDPATKKNDPNKETHDNKKTDADGDGGSSKDQSGSGNNEIPGETDREDPGDPKHEHKWEIRYRVVEHPEEGHYEEALIEDSWDESITAPKIVCMYPECGKTFESSEKGADEWGVHNVFDHESGGSYAVKDVVIKTIHHDAVYAEPEWVVDKEAFTEQIPMEKVCTECGQAEVIDNE